MNIREGIARADADTWARAHSVMMEYAGLIGGMSALHALGMRLDGPGFLVWGVLGGAAYHWAWERWRARGRR